MGYAPYFAVPDFRAPGMARFVGTGTPVWRSDSISFKVTNQAKRKLDPSTAVVANAA
jgi:hypothetical protein